MLPNRVGGVEVLKDHLAANQLAVDNHGEAYVQDDVVVYGQAQEQAYQPILVLRLVGHGVEPVLLGLLIKQEHS